MKMKEESEKAGLKLNTQKTKIMASHPRTSWQVNGERVETVADPKSLKLFICLTRSFHSLPIGGDVRLFLVAQNIKRLCVMQET